jgi:NADH:ubiquinone oxidoreductase subunit F (NADH-binding)
MPQERVVLRNCGLVDPGDLDSYIARGGFQALKKAMAMTPDAIIAELKASGLRGRGGAGFPVGIKWEGARKAPGKEHFVICNADEGEVGTFKDRYIIQRDPFSLIEGIIIAGLAIGASQAFVYLRAEYHYLLEGLRKAVAQTIKASPIKDFEIEVREGAGAYVCGEESALMESIEGKRGESRFRPPFPVTSGLWQEPTIINNVETMMNIVPIMLNGAAWFSQMGTERSKGTKVFSVAGDVAKPGVYEMVLGSSLRELVDDVTGAKDVMMVQIGGATGRILPYSKIDTPLAFESVLGAGAITVFGNKRDVIDIVIRTMEFLAEESCGKCTPCRQGTEVLLEMMDRFHRGEGRTKDFKAIQDLAGAMGASSLCGLGQAAPFAVLDSLQYFRPAYESRIRA